MLGMILNLCAVTKSPRGVWLLGLVGASLSSSPRNVNENGLCRYLRETR